MVEGSLWEWAGGADMSKSRGGRRSLRTTSGGLVPVISVSSPSVELSAIARALSIVGSAKDAQSYD
jgi:hypothetical protein